MEIMIVFIVIAVMSGFAVKPVSGLIQRIKLKNAADGIKHHIVNARVKAMADTQRRCGVVFRVHPGAAINDTIQSFLDKAPSDNIYTAGVDSLYLSPHVIRKDRDKIEISIPQGYPSVIVFRGDGSANASARLVLTLNAFKDTVDVLASTGRVRTGGK